MKSASILALAGERLQVYGARAVLAALGVSIGVALMIILGNTVATAHARATAGLRAAGADVYLVTSVTTLSRGNRPRPLTVNDAERIVIMRGLDAGRCAAEIARRIGRCSDRNPATLVTHAV